MKKITLSNQGYVLFHEYHYIDHVDDPKSIVIIPNSAGYYATHNEPFGKAQPHLDAFISSLAQKFRVYYVVLPGQDPALPDTKYSWTGSVSTAKEALQYVVANRKLTGVIGICTGGAVAAEALWELGLGETPLVLYNTALSVGWHIPQIQDKFEQKYGRNHGGPVELDRGELTQNAPRELASSIQKHIGRIMQLACHKSDYSIENQLALQTKIPKINTIEFMRMGDVPLENDHAYDVMIQYIYAVFS